MDDVIIGSPTEREHLITLERVFERLHSHGLKLKQNKCLFLVDEVKYLGFIISKDGIKVDTEKVEAISKIPRPQDVTELKSFLGLVNFYAKFIKKLEYHFSAVIQPFKERGVLELEPQAPTY